MRARRMLAKAETAAFAVVFFVVTLAMVPDPADLNALGFVAGFAMTFLGGIYFGLLMRR